MYTHCPHCLTVFRIHAEQLTQARGQVRCGVCNNCFNALETLTEHLAPLPASAAPSGAALGHGAQFAPPEQHAPVSLAEPAQAAEQTATLGAEHEIDLETLGVSLTTAGEPAEAGEQVAVAPERKAPPFSAEPPEGDEGVVLSLPERAVAAQTPDITAPPHEKEDVPMIPLSAEEDHALPDLGIIAAEPLPVTAEEDSGSRLQTALWAGVNIALIALLLGQYAYFNRHDLVQYPELRPWLSQLCAVASCDTPLRRDVSRITLANRIVESHPRVPNALLIDATLVNDADFPQPYPLLEIRFSDLNNHLVAGRRFRPGEYLAAGTSLQSGLPPHQAVHITLEISDPGKEAVGFQFEML